MKLSDEKTIDELVRRVGEYVVNSLQDNLRSTLEAEISKALYKAINEGRFYKCVSEELHGGIAGLFRDISEFKKSAGDLESLELPDTEKAGKMLSEASDQLDYIFKSTEAAATRILDIVEKNIALQEKIGSLLDKAASGSNNGVIVELKAINKEVENDYMEVMTALSFQDITGQRINKVIGFLSFMENEVLRLLISAGVKMKEKEANPDRDADQIISEAEAKVDTTLRASKEMGSQADIDRLLAELGL